MSDLEKELIKQIEFVYNSIYVDFRIPEEGECYITSGHLVGYFDKISEPRKRIILKQRSKNERA